MGIEELSSIEIKIPRPISASAPIDKGDDNTSPSRWSVVEGGFSASGRIIVTQHEVGGPAELIAQAVNRLNNHRPFAFQDPHINVTHISEIGGFRKMRAKRAS
jgi:hypothetical protein